ENEGPVGGGESLIFDPDRARVARSNARYDLKFSDRLFRLGIDDLAPHDKCLWRPEHVLLVAGYERLIVQAHPSRWADVGPELVEGGFVPFPDSLLGRVLAEVI